MKTSTPQRSPWFWVPSLYFAEAIPYVLVMSVSVIMYKRLGVSNADLALLTSWLYLPWVLKFVWAPVVDLLSRKRRWVLGAELVLAGSLAGMAMALHGAAWLPVSLGVFWVLAFASATQDIAADGFYMLALDGHEQAAFVGVRSTFYKLASVVGQGVVVVLAGTLESTGGNLTAAWSMTFLAVGAAFALLWLYHRLMLPVPALDAARGGATNGQSLVREFMRIFREFFRKPRILQAIAFLLFYRLAEAQLVKMVSPFLLDGRDRGGLGMSTSEVGVVYGTIGMGALIVGGLLGGAAVARHGMGRWFWPMVLLLHLPDLVFVYLAHVQPESRVIIGAGVALEQFGYGFGFTAYALFMILLSEGTSRTAHYALCTCIMALGMMLPGMASGALQEWLGYRDFFLWVIASTIPGFFVAALARVPHDFGKRVTPSGAGEGEE